MRNIYPVIFILFLTACSNLSRSERDLRREFLAVTPIGTSMEESITRIKKKIKPKGGVFVRENNPCLEREKSRHQKGSHSLKVNLGWYYWGVTETTAIGEWCFNDRKNLIDIVVYKEFEDPR